MAVSPFRRRLYRNPRWAVICLLAGWAVGQGSQPKPASTVKGPRALGLLELAPNGKAHLIPIAILDEGQFYDASAYKASPVPTALDSGTVYEAMKTGVSQGLFTVSAAGHLGQAWIGQGTWKAAGSEPPAKAADAKPKEEIDAPPKLRRPGTEAKPTDSKPAESQTQAQAPVAPPPATPPSPPPPPQPAEDKDRPVLRRGKPAPRPEEPEEPAPKVAAPGKSPAKTPAATASSLPAGIQLIPAISDAAGPEPRPYTYGMKPDEQAQFQKKMLAIASEEVAARSKELSPAPSVTPKKTAAPRHSGTAANGQQVVFENVQLRVLDLSSSNEPVAVLTAEARMRQIPPGSAIDKTYLVTIVARENIYGELHKAFAEVTDAQHLDVLPRIEFIDAVDADGDGRGELLFRRVYDTGSAFTIYRVIGDRVWPLFEGVPSR